MSRGRAGKPPNKARETEKDTSPGTHRWHPLVSDVLAMLVRPEGGPSVDEQLAFAVWLSSLPDTERDEATAQLGMIMQRLREAGETETARVVQGIALFADQQDAMPHAAARVRSRLET